MDPVNQNQPAQPGRLGVLGLEGDVIDMPHGADASFSKPGELVIRYQRSFPPGTMLFVLPPEMAAQVRGQMRPAAVAPQVLRGAAD